MSNAKLQKNFWIPVIVGALGYFVDIYDLVLFSIVRVASLNGIGVPPSEQLDVGILLINSQMGGMLVGGVFWGILGDKKGRLSVLFGSIFLYSIANILNGFVTNVPMYAVLRFVAGVGLAGELGAAITLVSETLPTHLRGFGTAIVAGVGLSGAVFAGILGDKIPWNWAFIIGGCLGLLLLLMRMGILESELFSKAKEQNVRRGEISLLLKGGRLLKYLSCIAVGVPIWFVVGILITFSPEITKELGVSVPVNAGRSILFCYAGLSIGDLFSGFLSQWIKSRKKIVMASLIAVAGLSLFTLLNRDMTDTAFYYLCFGLGLAIGYWAVFITIASEQFGTNLRSTVTTSVPNFVRGSVVLMTLSFKGLSHHMSLVQSAMIVGTVTVLVALIGISFLSESYGKDLNFMEVE